MKKLLKPIISGAFIDDKGNLQFNWTHDKLYRDVVMFNTNTSGQMTDDGVRIIYGYKYNPECRKRVKKAFRDAIKHPDITSDILEFVERGVLHIDDYAPLDNFDAIVSIRPSRRPSILDLIKTCLLEHVCKTSISFELIKETCENVKFDTEKARVVLIDAGYSEDEAIDQVDQAVRTFEALKSKGAIFEMKKFLPRPIRYAFSDFLKFATESEKQTYERLQGIDALMYDDFFTSGATVHETTRYLRSINPRNTLTVFVLIQQD